MDQDALFYESINDSLDAVVKGCGGAKVVGCKLWPEKTPDSAHRLLLACLNEDRVEKLGPEQVMFLLRMGRERGCHVAMNFITRTSGYADATPVEPEDERARLQREFIEATKYISKIAGRMDGFGMLRAVGQ